MAGTPHAPVNGKGVNQATGVYGKVGPGKQGPAGPALAGPGVPLNSPILDPSQPLTGQDLYNAAQAIANAQTQGPYSELARQIATNQQQTQGALKLTGGYFSSLGNTAKQGLQSEQGIGSNLNSQLRDIGSQTQGTLTGLGQDAQTALSRYTPQSDSSFASPAMQSLTSEIARQQGLAAQSSGIQRGAGAIQGANYSGLAASNLGTGALAGQEALTGIARAGQLENEPLTAKQAALIQNKGALLGDALGKLRQQEITNKITYAGLGLKQQAIKTSAATAKAARQAANQRAKISQQGANSRNAATIAGENARNEANIDVRQAIAKAHAHATGGKPLTQPEQNTLYGQMDTLGALIQHARDAGFPAIPGKGGAPDTPAIPHPTQGQITQHLLAGTNPRGVAYPAALVNAVFELRQTGFITPATAAGLRRLGLRGGQFNGKPIKVRQPAAAIPGIGAIPGV